MVPPRLPQAGAVRDDIGAIEAIASVIMKPGTGGWNAQGVSERSGQGDIAVAVGRKATLEIGYIHVTRLLLMRQGLQGIEHRWPRKPRYLELGFGQASAPIHAAAEGEFWGCDFAHAGCERAGHGNRFRRRCQILDASFEELANRSDPPTSTSSRTASDLISDANRRLIVEIARRYSAVGGVFTSPANTTPGWSAAMLRHR